MFSYISSHLTDATVPDWSSFWEPKWFWSVTNSCGTLSLDVNIKLGHDLPVDVRNASIFGSWLSGRGDVWFVSIPALERLFLIWMFSAWFTQLGFLVPSGSSQFTFRTACSAWDVASVSPKFVAPGSENQTDCITESAFTLSSEFPTSVGVIRL